MGTTLEPVRSEESFQNARYACRAGGPARARAALPWMDGVVREGAPVVLVLALALSNASEHKGCPVRREECTPNNINSVTFRLATCSGSLLAKCGEVTTPGGSLRLSFPWIGEPHNHQSSPTIITTVTSISADWLLVGWMGGWVDGWMDG